MKLRSLAVVTIATAMLASMLVPASALPPTKEELTKLYNEGVALYNQQNWNAADQKFVELLKLVPRHVPSQRYRGAISDKKRAEAMVPDIYKQLAALTEEKVSFDEATLEEAVEYIKQRAKALSDGKVVPNIILRPTKDSPDFAERKITFNLNKVPLSDVLDMIGKSTKTKFSFDKYAIIGEPTADPKGSGVIFTKPTVEEIKLKRGR
jgi:hypothetical protein